METAKAFSHIHASAVAVGTAGLLITGQSGSGKSTLALELMALGARLIADDQVCVSVSDNCLLMTAPPTLAGRIEARGMGILRAENVAAVATAVVDLDQTETDRIPLSRQTVIKGVPLKLFHRVESPAFASMLYVLLTGGLE